MRIMKKTGRRLLFVMAFCAVAGCKADTGVMNGDAGSEAASLAVLDWQSQYELGIRFLNEGNYEEAILAFTAAIEIEPNRAAPYLARGDAYAAQEDGLESGAADYGRAVTLLSGWYGGGQWREADGMLPETMTYEEAVSRAVKLYEQLAGTLAEAGGYEAAIEAVKKAGELLTDCVVAEEDDGPGGGPGISPELWEQLYGEISGLLETYETLAGAGELNAYKATVFEQRENYRAYDTLSAQEQAWIDRLIGIAQAGNVAALEAELPGPDTGGVSGGFTIYTSRDSYRVFVNGHYTEHLASQSFPGEPWPYDEDPLDKGAFIQVEVREENGAAYACMYSRGEGYAGGSSSDEEGWVMYTGTRIAELYTSGSCKDWQWEGAFTATLMESQDAYEGSEFNHKSVATETETGTMAAGVREGSFTKDMVFEYTSPSYEDTSRQSETFSCHGGVYTQLGYEMFRGALMLDRPAEDLEDMYWREQIFW
ncbi:MAG: tetratricopeptide repeat protein [Lachnospiraceae bacterium]|nr:tetratricopeptide repeat protein [Lachnospiraceae bacterium]